MLMYWMKNINITKKNTEVLLQVSTEVDLEDKVYGMVSSQRYRLYEHMYVEETCN
jgi:hypothetical protein